MKKWEINTIRSILADMENIPKPAMENGKAIQRLPIEQQAKINATIAELNEISKLIPELNILKNKIYYKNFPDIKAILCSVISRGEEKIKNDAEILYLINKWKYTENPKEAEIIQNQIARKFKNIEPQTMKLYGIKDIQEESNKDFYNLENTIQFDLEERLSKIEPDEEQNEDFDKAYNYRRMNLLYKFMKTAFGTVYAKNRIIETMERSGDRVLQDFIPTLKSLDTEFFETYLDYLKSCGNYLITIHTNELSKETKKEFDHILGFAQKAKDTMLNQKRENPFFSQKTYSFKLGKPNIIREKDGAIIYLQSTPKEKAYTYQISITEKEEQMSSREKATIIEKILGLEKGEIYLYGLQAINGNNMQRALSQTKLPQTRGNLNALNEILSKVDPAILKAYEQMQTDLSRILSKHEEYTRILKREDIKEQLRNFVDITTQRVREDIRKREQERKRQSFNDEVRNYIDGKLQEFKSTIDPGLSLRKKVLILKKMVLEEIKKKEPGCKIEDLMPLDYETLYSKFFRIEAKYNHKKYMEIVTQKEDKAEKVDQVLLQDDSINKKEEQRRIYQQNVSYLVQKIKSKNPDLTQEQAVMQAKDLIIEYIKRENPKYNVKNLEEAHTEMDLVVPLLDLRNQTACGNITYNISENELEEVQPACAKKIGEYMLTANSMQIASFTENTSKLKISRVSGSFGRLKAAIRNFRIQDELLYDGIQNNEESNYSFEDEKNEFLEELKSGISKEIRLAKKEIKRIISGFRKEKVSYKKEKKLETKKSNER